MDTPLKVALLRGVIVAAIAAGGAFFLALGQGMDGRGAGIVAGGTFFATLTARGLGEGAYDSGSTIQRNADAAKSGSAALPRQRLD